MSDSTVDSTKAITVHHDSAIFRHISVPGNPTIMTHNIASGWDTVRVDDLEAAVHRLVDRNPILSATLHYTKVDIVTGKKTRGVFAEPHKHTTFVHHVPAPKDIPRPAVDLPNRDATTMTNYIETYIQPLIPPSKRGSEEIDKKLPLFGIHIMKLPDGYVYYAPFLSHVIGDGPTYYQLMEELDAIFTNSKLPEPIIWGTDVASSFEMIGMHQLRQPLYWLGLIIAAIVNLVVRGFPKTQQIILSKKKIDQKKKELAARNDNSFLSTNDIVTAALAQALAKDFDYSIHAVNFRAAGRCPGAGTRDGGNIIRLVPYGQVNARGNTTEVIANQVRAQTESLSYTPDRYAPTWSMVQGRHYNQTNWANIQYTLEGTIFHSPQKSLVDRLDLPMAVIYQANRE